MNKILFFRGLNSYQDEFVHAGPLKVGLQYQRLKEELKNKDFELVPVLGLGVGSMTNYIQNAKNFLDRLPEWKQGKQFHILGHSVGGLIARQLVQEPEFSSKIKSIITVGTPHYGAHVADDVENISKNHPLLYYFGRSIGFDLKKRMQYYHYFKTQSLVSFNKEVQNQPGITYGHVACWIDPVQLNPLFKNIYRVSHPEPEESDGFIYTRSQVWGEELGRLNLDHAEEIGYSFHVKPSERRRASHEFGKLTRLISEFCSGL